MRDLEPPPKKQKFSKELKTPPSLRAKAQRFMRVYGSVGCSICTDWRGCDGKSFEKHFLSKTHTLVKPEPRSLGVIFTMFVTFLPSDGIHSSMISAQLSSINDNFVFTVFVTLPLHSQGILCILYTDLCTSAGRSTQVSIYWGGQGGVGGKLPPQMIYFHPPPNQISLLQGCGLCNE